MRVVARFLCMGYIGDPLLRLLDPVVGGGWAGEG